ncbi:MAG: DUF951 domain-containing protein [Clostridia bacterium]|nr:DUF951 domain-containing protein [Clostridia bacterium]
MYALGDVLRLKKPHPCGGTEWRVVRLGADVKLQCSTCGKFINCARDDLKKRVQAVVASKGEY